MRQATAADDLATSAADARRVADARQGRDFAVLDDVCVRLGVTPTMLVDYPRAVIAEAITDATGDGRRLNLQAVNAAVAAFARARNVDPRKD